MATVNLALIRRIDAYVAGWREAVLEVFTQQEALLKRDRAGPADG